MIYEKIKLFDDRENVFLEVFCADKIWDMKRDAILVIPGGGYSGVCSDREGEPIALAFLARGMNAFVLHYSVGAEAATTRPLLEASAAMKYIKDNSEKYNINPDRVFACGFSAGGHLCASLGTLWHLPEATEGLNMPYGYNKPAGIMPIYAVITPFVPDAHMVSFYNLFGSQNPDESLMKKYSLSDAVDEKSSPAFIVHTTTDQLVTVQNSLAFAKAYADRHMKFEMHIYPDAPHGVALANDITSMGNSEYDNSAIAKWVDHAVEWTKQI